MGTKLSDIYGRGIPQSKDSPAGPLEVASGDIGPVGNKPVMVWLGLAAVLVIWRLIYEMGE